MFSGLSSERTKMTTARTMTVIATAAANPTAAANLTTDENAKRIRSLNIAENLLINTAATATPIAAIVAVENTKTVKNK